MDSSKKTWNDQEKKKLAIKIGGGGGGIGAVILLGGALATAALASAFAVRVKGRSSAKDRSRCHQNPPPEKNEEFICTDHQHPHVLEHPSEGEMKGAVSENGNTEAFLVSTESSTMDVKEKIEINGDVEASDQSLCLNSPKKLEKDVVIDDGFIVDDDDFPLLEEKSPLDSQNKMPEDEKTEVELTKENVSNDYSKEHTNIETEEGAESKRNDDGEVEEVTESQPREEEKDVEGVNMDRTKEEERENMEREEVEGLCISDGEINEEKKCVEAIERAKVDLSEDGSNQEVISNVDSVSEITLSETHSKDEEEEVKALLPEFECVVAEHENVDGNERESASLSESMETVEEDGATEESREDEAKYVPEDKEEENILIPHENKQEKILKMIEELIHEATQVTKEDVVDSHEVCENKISTKFDAEKDDKNGIKQRLISPEDVEITKGDANEEVLEENTEKGVEKEVIYHENIEAAKDDIIYEEADARTEESENKTSDEEEEEGEYQTKDSPKLKRFNREVEGKILEDKTVKEDDHNGQKIYQKSGEKVFTSEKITFISDYMVKNLSMNSSKRRMVIVMLSLLSCSWYFGLSFAKLCIVLFLTMLVSEIRGY